MALNPYTGNSAALSAAPDELQPQLQQAGTQQRMAELLMAQAMQGQPQGQMISGHYVAPSWSQQLAPIANQALGLYAGYQAEKGMSDYAKALRSLKSKEEEGIIQAMTPKPARAEEMAGPAYKGVIPSMQYPAQDPNYFDVARLIKNSQTGAGKEYLPEVIKKMNPESPTSVLEFKEAEKNPRFANYQREQANLKAPKNTFNISDIMGKDIGQVKDILMAGQSQVQAGEMSLNAANKIDQAIKSGNLNVGPTANVGQYMGQLGDSLGFVNQKGQEKLVNTRQALQGLAQMWASSRSQAKGQGTMTEGESQLYGKISSGELDKISIPELKYMVESTKNQGNYYRSEYENKLNVLRKNPKFADIIPLYEVGSMPNVQWNSGAGNSQNINNALSIVRGNQGGANK